MSSLLDRLVLPGAQRDSVLRSTARLNMWEGSVRSGKTYGSIHRFVHFTQTGPQEARPILIGKTERTLYRNVIDPMIEMYGARRIRYSRGSGEMVIGDRQCWVGGANDVSAEARIRGLTLSGAYGDEVTLWPEIVFRQLLSRMSVAGAKLFATMNPDVPGHYIRTDFLDNDELDLARFTFTLADNPTLNDEYVENLKLEYGPPTSVWYRRYILGHWTLAEGLVWDSFDRKRHVTKRLPQMARYWMGVDYGTVNPFVGLLIGLGLDDRLYVCAEWRWDSKAKRLQLTDSEYSKRLKDWLGPITPRRWYVDPSAASFKTQMWRDQISGVTNANNSVEDGLRVVATLMNLGRLRIHESCTGLIGEIESYAWDEKAAEAGAEKPRKRDDHGPDALRYGMMGLRNEWRHWVSQPALTNDDE